MSPLPTLVLSVLLFISSPSFGVAWISSRSEGGRCAVGDCTAGRLLPDSVTHGRGISKTIDGAKLNCGENLIKAIASASRYMISFKNMTLYRSRITGQEFIDFSVFNGEGPLYDGELLLSFSDWVGADSTGKKFVECDLQKNSTGALILEPVNDSHSMRLRISTTSLPQVKNTTGQ